MTRFATGTDQLSRQAFGRQLAGGANHRMVSLFNRFQNGYLTDLAFAPASTDYTDNPVIFKMLRAPTGFGYLEEGNMYVQAYVNIIETLMQTWTGLNRTLNVSVAETEIGKNNEVFQTPTRVARTRSNLTSTIAEKDGMPVWRFFDDLVRLLIKDPDVGHPLMSGISPNFNDQLNDQFSIDLLAYQPDKTFKFCNQAWLFTNVFPINEVGENIASRMIRQEAGLRVHNLTWSSIQKVGYAVDELGQKFMNESSVMGIDPSYQPNFINGMRGNVASVATSAMNQINELKQQMIQRPEA